MKWPFQKKHNEQQARDKPTKQRKQMLNLRSINRPRADRTIEGNEAIYAAVSRIANTMASMPMHLYKGYEIAKSHPLERLINLEPHPNFSAFTWRQTMEVLRNTEGNAYALIVRDKMGQITRLDILNPTRVQPARDPTDGSDWYIITLDDGQPYQVPGFMVLNIRHMSANGVKGIRPIDVLRRSLDYDAQVKDLALDQLDGVNHGIMLTVPNTGLDQDAKGKFAEPTQTAQTDSDSMNYQHPTIEATFVRREWDNSLAAIVATADNSIPATVITDWFQQVYEPAAA